MKYSAGDLLIASAGMQRFVLDVESLAPCGNGNDFWFRGSMKPVGPSGAQYDFNQWYSNCLECVLPAEEWK